MAPRAPLDVRAFGSTPFTIIAVSCGIHIIGGVSWKEIELARAELAQRSWLPPRRDVVRRDDYAWDDEPHLELAWT